MTRTLLALLAVGVAFLSIAVAEDKPKLADDAVAAELTKAKQHFQAAVKSAGEKLAAAFEAADKKAEKDMTLSAEQYLKLSKLLAEERAAFEADSAKLPVSSPMKAAANKYLNSMADAKKDCETAFSKAAASYRGKDNAAMEAVLAEWDEFKKHSLGFVRKAPVGPVPKSIEGREKLTLAIMDTTWEWPTKQAVLVFRSDGLAVYSANDSVVTWVAIDTRTVILRWPTGDFDVVQFDSNYKSYEKDWIGKPGGRSLHSGRRIDTK